MSTGPWPRTASAGRRRPPVHRVHRFLATGDPEPFARLGRRFLGPEVRDVERTPGWVTGS